MPANVVDGAIILPFRPSVGSYDFTCAINQRTYVWFARWNTRDKAWMLDISDENSKPIIVGVKVVLGAFLGRMRQDVPLFTEGVLVATDLSINHNNGQGKEAGFDDFGTRVIVQYIPILEWLFRVNLQFSGTSV